MSIKTYNDRKCKMEAPTEELKVFSSILLQEYIRLMTAADYVGCGEKDIKGTKFAISEENYRKMMAEPLQTALIGLDIHFSDGILTAIPSEDFLKQYENKIMKEVVQMFAVNYKKRYAEFIKIIEENN